MSEASLRKSHQHGHLSIYQNKDNTRDYTNTEGIKFRRPELLTANYRQLWNRESRERNSLMYLEYKPHTHTHTPEANKKLSISLKKRKGKESMGEVARRKGKKEMM